MKAGPNPATLFRNTFPSPLGPLQLVWTSSGALKVLDFVSLRSAEQTALLPPAVTAEVPVELADALHAYFDGNPRALDALVVEPEGTPFRKRVWGALRGIPWGETWSYAKLAEAIGAPRAVRAVGGANGANPIAIVIPCHRVIGKSGALIGYACGLDKKAWLLEHEGKTASASRTRSERVASKRVG